MWMLLCFIFLLLSNSNCNSDKMTITFNTISLHSRTPWIYVGKTLLHLRQRNKNFYNEYS